jgi:hypothetical protein
MHCELARFYPSFSFLTAPRHIFIDWPRTIAGNIRAPAIGARSLLDGANQRNEFTVISVLKGVQTDPIAYCN